IAVSSSKTIFTSCCAGLTVRSCDTPTALLVTRSRNSPVSWKLTSASSRTLRTSRRPSLMSASDNVPRPRSFANVASSLEESSSNMSLLSYSIRSRYPRGTAWRIASGVRGEHLEQVGSQDLLDGVRREIDPEHHRSLLRGGVIRDHDGVPSVRGHGDRAKSPDVLERRVERGLHAVRPMHEGESILPRRCVGHHQEAAVGKLGDGIDGATMIADELLLLRAHAGDPHRRAAGGLADDEELVAVAAPRESADAAANRECQGQRVVDLLRRNTELARTAAQVGDVIGLHEPLGLQVVAVTGPGDLARVASVRARRVERDQLGPARATREHD